jgi:ankyrin repeat protein
VGRSGNRRSVGHGNSLEGRRERQCARYALDTRSSRNGRFALNWAALNDHPEIIKLLLARGAAINGQNLSGYTALHHAGEAGSASATQALLAGGADPDIRNANGATAADVARANGHMAVAEFIEKARGRSR